MKKRRAGLFAAVAKAQTPHEDKEDEEDDEDVEDEAFMANSPLLQAKTSNTSRPATQRDTNLRKRQGRGTLLQSGQGLVFGQRCTLGVVREGVLEQLLREALVLDGDESFVSRRTCGRGPTGVDLPRRYLTAFGLSIPFPVPFHLLGDKASGYLDAR